MAVVKLHRTRRPLTLPLGIDIGAERVRVALLQRGPDGGDELLAVAARACGDDPTAAVVSAVAELRTSERRCVFGLSEPRAVLRRVRLPAMSRAEHDRAARYEATRHIDYPIDEAMLRVLPRQANGDTIIGIARKDAINSLVAMAHAAKLRVSAIDNDALAFRRALRDVDAVLDVGVNESRLHIFTGTFPIGRRFATGGAALTAAIADALGCDEATARRRKHTHGIAGCREEALNALVSDVASALVECRASGLGDVRAVALAGNGARLAELPAAIERAAAVRVRLAQLDPLVSRTLPADVLRAAAPDWALAIGLARWAAP